MTADLLVAWLLEAANHKRCTDCHDKMARCNYRRDRSRPDGLSRRCAKCDTAKSRAYQRDRREAIASLRLFAGALN